MAMLTKIKLLLLPSFFLLMAVDCGHGCYPTLITKSRSIGTNDVFTITPLKKVYKVGDTVRIKMVVNVMANLVDETGNFTDKKINLYDLRVRKLRVAPLYPEYTAISSNPKNATVFLYMLKTIKIHTADGYYPEKKQFIYKYDGVIQKYSNKYGKYHLKQGDLGIEIVLEVIECDEEYVHIHTLNFKDMKFEVVE